MKKLLFSILLICLSGNAGAFDGDRKGFTIGAGGGAGLLTDVEEFVFTGVFTQFKLGVGTSDRVQLEIGSRQHWLKGSANETFYQAIPTIGVTLFARPHGGSFTTFGVGGSLITRSPFDSTPVVLGPSGVLGVGYEMRTGVLVEFDTILTFAIDHSPILNFALTLNFQAY